MALSTFRVCNREDLAMRMDGIFGFRFMYIGFVHLTMNTRLGRASAFSWLSGGTTIL